MASVEDADVGLALRFAGYRGPAGLLAVLVREGDMAASQVPVARLAARVEAWEGDESVGASHQVGALASLTEVWRRRLTAAVGLAQLPGDEEGDAPEPFEPDEALALAVRALGALEETSRERLGRAPAPPASSRLGAPIDLWQAYAHVQDRRERTANARRLWPAPPARPLLFQMRRLLSGLRRRRRMHLVGADRPAPEAVAATLAALELVRRGRARLWQQRAYAPVVLMRPGTPGEGSEEG